MFNSPTTMFIAIAILILVGLGGVAWLYLSVINGPKRLQRDLELSRHLTTARYPEK